MRKHARRWWYEILGARNTEPPSKLDERAKIGGGELRNADDFRWACSYRSNARNDRFHRVKGALEPINGESAIEIDRIPIKLINTVIREDRTNC